MEIREAQRAVDRWIRTYGNGYFDELTNMAILAEEVGEVARIISRVYGRQVAKKGDLDKNLGDELADVMWVVMCLANQTGVDLTEALLASIDKETRHDAGRFRDAASPSAAPQPEKDANKGQHAS